MRQAKMVEPITTLPGIVYGLGQEVDGPTRLYASLTGRQYRLCRTIKEIQASRNDVVVCKNSDITSNFMHQLYVQSGDGAPGLITASTLRILEDVCRKQAAKFARPHAQNPKRVFLQSTGDFTSYEKDGDHYIGGMERKEALLSALSMNASLLLVDAHSDGIDLNLNYRHFLCPLLDPIDSQDPLTPTCEILGQCTQFPSYPKIAHAERAGWLLPLRVLRAGIGVISACNVVRVRDDYVGPSYNLGLSLLHRGDFGAIVTTWRREMSGPGGSHLNGLINDLSAGEKVGVAVGTFNRSTAAIRLGSVKLCVLGDPCFSIPPNGSYVPLPLPEDPSLAVWEEEKRGAYGASPTKAEVALLKTATLNALNINTRLDPVKGRELLAALDALDLKSDREASPADFEIASCAALDFLAPSPFLGNYYLYPFSGMDQLSETVTCPMCLGKAKGFRLTFPTHNAQPRNGVRCPACGDCSLTPVGWHLQADLSRVREGRFVISGFPAGTHLRAYLINVDGSLYRALDVDPSNPWFCFPKLPTIPLYCQVLMISSLQIGSVGFKFRPLSDGRFQTLASADL
jgi:hypothetical protein